MATASCITTRWDGFIGAPGWSKIWFEELADSTSRNNAGAAVSNFWLALVNFYRAPFTWTVSPIVQNFDIQTGQLTNEFTMSTVPNVRTGTVPNTTAYAGGTGCVVHWQTGVVLDGRKVTGKTFLVPTTNMFEADGTITTTARTTIADAGNALATNVNVRQVVYHRVFDKKAGEPGRTQVGGNLVRVSAAVVPDRSATMRSRRV